MTFDQDPNVYESKGIRQSFACPRSSLDGWSGTWTSWVQLLQSDEPEEVTVIKMVLIQHLELDSKVTLGILCDQIVPPDDPIEDEDKTIRKRPEVLVVAFLARDPRKPLLAHLQDQRCGAAEQEDALIDTFIKAVSTSSAAARQRSSRTSLRGADGV
ncbi:hypothetical protein EDB83DRAFT_1924088 [Lactarius deliciosus]|nr:hypothetical protein EDB83DRAFT_1924088 [Lactarius deliciosus]